MSEETGGRVGDLWRGFSNIQLTKADKLAVKKMAWGSAECMGYLQSMVDDLYKVTVSYDWDNHCYTVSATGKGEANAGLTMTQRHSDLFVAIAAHAHCHLEKTQAIWPEPNQLEFDW